MSFAEKNSTQKSGLAFPSKAGNRHQLEPFRLQLMTDILSAGHGAAMQDDLADVTFTDLPSDNARKSASAAYGIIMKTLTTTQRDTSWLAALEGAEPDMRLNGAWLFRRVMERKPRRMATLAARTKAREALHALMMALPSNPRHPPYPPHPPRPHEASTFKPSTPSTPSTPP